MRTQGKPRDRYVAEGWGGRWSVWDRQERRYTATRYEGDAEGAKTEAAELNRAEANREETR